jgi:acetyl-CoA C-acetyltransferase
MHEAVIVDAVRTPIGRAIKGTLKDVRADDLAAVPLRALQDRNPQVPWAQTDDILWGAAIHEGEQGMNLGRRAGLLAGIDHHVPGMTLNRFCSSSLQTIRMAAHAIKAARATSTSPAGRRPCRARPARPSRSTPQLDGSPESRYDVYIPMGMTGRERGEALPTGHPRAAG